MLRFLIGLLFLSSCSVGVIRTGGDESYSYNEAHHYTLNELQELAPKVIETSQRDPQVGKLSDLFSPEQAPLRRIGILVFESVIQPSRSGLTDEDLIYLSAAGKQLMTENLLSIWQQSLPILGPTIDYVDLSEIKGSKAFSGYGTSVKDQILSERDILHPDDIFFLPKGKNVTTTTTLNPRGMRDLSLALVPASELMAGPKFSEHAKHAVNDIARELKLDAVIIVMSRLHWTASHTDKHSGQVLPEEATVQLESSVLVPLSSYRARLINLRHKRDFPNTTIAYRSYTGKLKIPVNITLKPEEQKFEAIEKELLTPVLNAYNDLTHMLQLQLISDLNKTQK